MSDLTEKGILAGRNGNWEMAAVLFESAAKEGDSEAVFELAECYFYGEGKPQDYAKAASLYERAYPDGDKRTYEKLAECFRMRRDGLQSETVAEQFEMEAERIGREEQR